MKTIAPKDVGTANGSSEDFEEVFLRCQGLFKQIAERVLNGDDVEEAMQKSYDAAVRRRQSFPSDGEFRRWLVRTVLNEALMILREKESAAEASSEWTFWQTC